MPEEFFRNLPDGKYSMRVKTLKAKEASLPFPPGFSFILGRKQVVVFPEDEENKKAMGVVAPGCYAVKR